MIGVRWASRGIWGVLACAPAFSYACAPQESLFEAKAKLLVVEPEPAKNFQYGSAIATDDQTLVVGDNQTHLPDASSRNKGSVYVYARNWSTNSWDLTQTLEPDNIEGSSEIHFGEQITLMGNTLFVAAPRDRLPDNDGEQGSVTIFTRSGPGGQFTRASKVYHSPATHGGRFGAKAVSNGSFLAVMGMVGDSDTGVSVFSLQGSSATFLYDIPFAAPYDIAVTQSGVLVVLAEFSTFAYHLQTNSATALSTTLLPSLPYLRVTASNNSIALLDGSNGGTVAIAAVSTTGVTSASSVALGVSAGVRLQSIAYREGQSIVVAKADPVLNNVLLLRPSGASYAVVGAIHPPPGDRLQTANTFGTGLALGNDFVAVGESEEKGRVQVLPLETNATTDGATFQRQRLQASDCGAACPGSTAGIRFGNSVAMSGDIAVVGAVKLVSDPSGSLAAPAAHIYTRQDDNWVHAAAPALGGRTPRGLAVNGAGRVFIGQGTFVPPGSFSDGSVRVVELTNGSWTTTATITPTLGPNPEDQRVTSLFGDSISVNGDTIAVGSYKSVFVFSRNGDGSWSQVQRIGDDPSVDDNQTIARRVALASDYLAVSAELDNQILPQQGSVFVYARSGWTLDHKILPTASSLAQLRFGRALAIEGTTLVVGQNGFELGQIATYERTGTAPAPWVKTSTLRPLNGGRYAVGTSVSLSGDKILVGAAADPIARFQGGAAYFFSRVGATWDFDHVHVLLPTDDTSTASSFFGWDVALSGSRALIGAPVGGSSYIFEGLIDADQDGILAANDCYDGDPNAKFCAQAMSFPGGSGNLSFELLSGQSWTASPGSFSMDSVRHSDGATSLAVGAGPVRLNGPTLATGTLHEVGTTLAVDVFRTIARNDAVTLFMSVPALGIQQAPVGTADLSGLPTGRWVTVSAAIPNHLRNILLHRNVNASFSLFFNAGGPGLSVDRLHFSGSFARHIAPAPPAAGLSGAFTVTSDWGSGYCVALKLDNSSAAPITGWRVAFNTNGTTLTNSWNAAFSGVSGALTITSNQAWNATIAAAAFNQDVSVGFCASRASGQALPIISSVTPN